MLLRRHERKLDEARAGTSSIDPMSRLPIIRGLREEDVVDEGLRVAVVEREPARLDLDHHAVTRQEHVVRVRERELIALDLIRRDRRRPFEALAVATAKDVHRDAELVAAELGL